MTEPTETKAVPKYRNTNTEEHRLYISKYLYRFAWAVEICAVLIGLAIALAMAGTAQSEMLSATGGELGLGERANIFIALMPFFMVALVELTKIPFVGAFYKVPQIRWKLIFGFSLLFISIITFESALNGFERNFSALTFTIDTLKEEVVSIEENLDALESRKTDLQELTAESIENQYSERYEVLSAERAGQASVVQNRISELRGSQSSQYADSLEDQIADLRAQAAELRQDRASEIDRIQALNQTSSTNLAEEVASQRRSMQNQLSLEQSRLSNLESQVTAEIERANIFNRARVREDGESRIAEQQARVEELRISLNGISQLSSQTALTEQLSLDIAQINDSYQSRIEIINSEINELSTELSRSLNQQESDIADSIAGYSDELSTIQGRFDIQLQDISLIRDRDLARLENNEQNIAELDEQIFELEQQRVDLRTNINIEVGDNQVYRIARSVYNKESAADLEMDQVLTVAFIWFGSLAALVAFTGVMLALASYVVGDDRSKPKQSSPQTGIIPRNQLSRSFRRFLVFRRKLQRKEFRKVITKEVIREVPVERVVKVETPVEIVKKEIVHVPVYTNDSRLLDLKFSPEDS